MPTFSTGLTITRDGFGWPETDKIGIENPRVGGSIPSPATIQIKGLREIAGPFLFLMCPICIRQIILSVNRASR